MAASKQDKISEPSLVVGDLPETKRGRRTAWAGRLARLQSEAPGEWVDATATWGVSSSGVSSVKKILEDNQLKGEAVTRTTDGEPHLWVWVE